MAIQTKSVLKGYFETGDQPTQAQFIDLVDSHPNLTTAVADPTVNDDSGDGHVIGDVWLNTATPSLWVVSDVTVAAAVWTDVTSGGGTALPTADTQTIVKGSADATKLIRFEVDGLTTGTTRTLTAQDVDGTILVTGGSDVAIADGGTGQSTAQAAIDALSQVSGATNEHVLTKDTGTGNATWKAAGTGTVDTSGVPVANDIARFTDADTIEGRSYAELKADLNLEIGTDVLAQQTIGIADNNLLEVDDAAAADNDYAKFTAAGLEGQTYAQVRTDINVADGADVTGSNAPQAHAASHQNAGGDEISVVGLSGLLADGQTPIDHDHTGDVGDGGQLSLTAAVTGVLPVANGGTNRSAAPKHPLMLTAAGGMGTTTGGAGDANKLPEQAETTTNKVNYHYIAFATAESAFWNVVMPANWDAGTMTAKVYWTAPSGSNDVKWEIKARSFANDDALDQALGAAVTVEDTLLANGDVHITAATAAMTLAGTPAAGELCVFEVKRTAPAGTDLVGDAHLLGVKLEYTAAGYSES